MRRGDLLAATALSAVIAMAHPAAAQDANARPMGGQVTAGSATIGTTARTTTIDQTSNRAAIDWSSFNVGSAQTVDFDQPSSSAVTLNRVTGADPSAIAGRIDANGSIIITNPSGVVFAKGAQVNAQNLVVSTAGMTNQAFMAGQTTLDQPGHARAQVANAGTITVKQAGLAALVAPSVANSGVINAKLGHVVLAGAQTATLDLYGDGLVSIGVAGEVKQVPTGPDGRMVTALVTNSGTILADGGTIQLTAAAADGVVQTLVDAGGTLRANTTGPATGRIEIAGTGGNVTVDGNVSAWGTGPNQIGGAVQVAASDTTTIASTARISASGASGGGQIAIGTALGRKIGAGTFPTGTSSRTVIAKGASIAANATARGTGGTITVLSTQSTAIAGALSAKGGAQGGDGGVVELSGRQGFSLGGATDTSAPHGVLGSIVLDPTDLTIVADTGTSNITPCGECDPNIAYGDAPDEATVRAADIEALTGNIRLQASNNLVVDASVTLGNHDLTLEAGNDLTVNTGVTLTAAGSITLSAAASDIPHDGNAGSLQILGTVDSTGTGVTLNAGTGGISIGAGGLVEAQGFTAELTIDSPSGSFDETSGGQIFATDLEGTAFSVSLPTPTNQILNIGVPSAQAGIENPGFYVTSLDFALTNGVSLTTAGDLTASDIRIAAPGIDQTGGSITATSPTGSLNLASSLGITFAGTVHGAGAVTLAAAAGTIMESSYGVLIASTLAGSASGNVNLYEGGAAENNSVDRITNFSAGGLFSFADHSPSSFGTFSVDGLLNAGPTLALTNWGPVTLAGTLAAPAIFVEANDAENASGVQQIVGTLTQTGGSIIGTRINLNPQASFIQSAGTIQASSTGTVALASYGAISLSGAVSGGTVDIRSLAQGSADLATGPNIINEGTAASIIANVLTGSSGGSADFLGQGNTIGTLGAFSGGLQLVDSTGLTIAGPVTAGDLDLAVNGNLTLAGDITASGQGAGVADFDATGAITQQSGILTALILTGRAAGASFGALGSGVANVSTLDNFISTGDLTLVDAAAAAGPGTSALDIAGGNSAGTGDTLTVAYNQSLGLTYPAGQAASSGLLAPEGTIVLRNDVANGPLFLGGIGPDMALPLNAKTLVFGSPNGGSITVGGTAAGLEVDLAGIGTLDLQTAQSVTEQFGNGIIVGSLMGTVGAATLQGDNTIDALGAFTANTSFQLSDQNLRVTGPLSTQTGLLAATGSLELDAPINATTALLVSATGAITQPGGTITTRILSGTAGTTVDLDAANSIATLGGFSTGGRFTLNDTGPLTLGGTVTAPSLILSIAGALIEPSTTLQSAALNVTTLTATAADISLDAPGNSIALLGNVASTGNLTLSDTIPIQVVGAVSVGPGDTLTLADDAFSFGPGGMLTSPGGTVALHNVTPGRTFTIGGSSGAPVDAATLVIGTPNGNAISIEGALSLPNVGTLDLESAGAVTEAGGVNVATLQGAAGSLAFDSLNQIGTLAAFTTTGDLSLSNMGSLALVGPLTANTAELTTTGDLTLGAPITVTGALNLTVGGTLGQPANLLTAEPFAVGTLTGSAADVELDTTAVTLGNFTATNDLDLGSTGNLTVAGAVTGGAVRLNAAGDLAVSGAISSDFVLLDAADDLSLSPGATIIGDLAGQADALDVSLMAGRDLTDAGTISGTGLALAAGNNLTIAQGAQVSGASFVNLFAALDGVAGFNPAGALQVLGTVAASGSCATACTVVLGAGTGGAAIGGAVTTDGTLVLASTGALTEQSGGTIAASDLLGSAGSVALLTPDNLIATLGVAAVDAAGLPGLATTGGLAIVDKAPVTVSGTLAVGAGQTLMLADNATSFAPGSVLDAPSGTVSLQEATVGAGLALGADPTGLPVSASLLQIGDASAGPIALTGSYDLAALPQVVVQTAGSFATTAGSVLQATDLTLSAAQITLAGTLAADTLNIDPAAVTQTSGLLTVGTLTGSASNLQLGSTTGGATASIAHLGSFEATGAFNLVDDAPLSIDGDVTAPSLSISAPGSITLNGVTVTIGSAAPGLLQVTPGIDGSSQFTQLGTATLASADAEPATLQISQQGSGGAESFNDLQAPGQSLILTLANGGVASGMVDTGALLVSGSGGGAILTGMVANQSGPAAAAAAQIAPQPSDAYLFNGCEIGAVSCGGVSSEIAAEAATTLPTVVRPDVQAELLSTTVTAGVAPPTIFFDIPDLGMWDDQGDAELLLPNISDRDY